jgi:hypothetical protein
MEQSLIAYEFELETGRLRFELLFEQPSNQLIPVSTKGAPEWTKLDWHKCSNCPLDSSEHSHCPLALNIHRVVKETDGLFSHDEVRVKVRSKERYYGTKTTAQRALSSLLGLIIPCSGCPNTAALRPLAHFHLPFSNEKETTYRVVSMYLMAQYMRETQNLKTDFELNNFAELYEPIQIVNRQICERLRTVCEKDSSLNAVVILDTLSMIVPMTMQSNLEQLSELFSPLLAAKI